MFGKIYPQSAAHITTILGCFTILHFTDPRSLVLDPRFRFPIPDPAFPVKQLFGCSVVGCKLLLRGLYQARFTDRFSA